MWGNLHRPVVFSDYCSMSFRSALFDKASAESAVKKKHKHRPMQSSVHTTFVYGTVVPPSHLPCADCGQPPDAACHSMADGMTGAGTGGTSGGDTADWAAETCSCGRPFATKDGYDAHFVALHDAEPDPVENAKNDAEILDDTAVKVTAADRKNGGMSDGSYPITNQAQADSAWKLRNNSKNHSEAEVIAHIRSRVKALGLKMPGSEDSSSFECCNRKFFTDEAAKNHYILLHFPDVVNVPVGT